MTDKLPRMKMVSPDSLLMKVPQVTREEWEAASKTYFKEAQQIALRLPTRLT